MSVYLPKHPCQHLSVPSFESPKKRTRPPEPTKITIATHSEAARKEGNTVGTFSPDVHIKSLQEHSRMGTQHIVGIAPATSQTTVEPTLPKEPAMRTQMTRETPEGAKVNKARGATGRRVFAGRHDVMRSQWPLTMTGSEHSVCEAPTDEQSGDHQVKRRHDRHPTCGHAGCTRRQLSVKPFLPRVPAVKPAFASKGGQLRPSQHTGCTVTGAASSSSSSPRLCTGAAWQR